MNLTIKSKPDDITWDLADCIRIALNYYDGDLELFLRQLSVFLKANGYSRVGVRL